MGDSKVLQLAEMINDAGSVVFLTGAGISVESGIPDFRSAGGLWTRYDPSIYVDINRFMEDPSLYWSMSEEMSPLLEDAEPNPAHYAIAEFEKLGKCDAVLTQNIDYLHQRAGSTEVLELHGTYHEGVCIECGLHHDYPSFREEARTGKVPYCSHCKGVIKPNVILFGEALNMTVLERSINYAENCDLLIVIGCGLTVYPVASLPAYAKRGGAKLAYVNVAPTGSDSLADLIVPEKAGVAMKRAVEEYRILFGG